MTMRMRLGAGVSGGDALRLFQKFIRTKDPASLQETDEDDLGAAGGKGRLRKCLTALDLTSLGVGSCVGTGMYLVSGMVARKVAGPAVVLSFLIAAVASIFSGACYAEFGVRVPHTTGSAYMYSYVTVGELVAFVIGWNMVLEYLIGTSACACALSACFDALADGAITRSVGSAFGTLAGRPPDFLAFGITAAMTALLVAGARKSLLFTNVLNVINLGAWVFVMTAGLFYVDGANWSQHGGFLPFGWSGVLTGAATCFYAFIGFDIIATTGEESVNPRKDIPLAIVGSLLIILAAYVTTSMMLTLIVPYDQVDTDSALVAMFAHVGAPTAKALVAIGALAGLSVSMFGSMFPMPRVVYAMAKDGLIFKNLAQVWEPTGTPAVATVIFGAAAAFAALLIRLDILVEMMSIGTLLAYTLVSTCVLLLRYQPHSTTLIDLLPEALRTPCPGSPVRDAPDARDPSYLLDTAAAHQHPAAKLDFGDSSEVPQLGRRPSQVAQMGPVTVRRVTRFSPDSDETTQGDTDADAEQDDTYLVRERGEPTYYGGTAGGGSAGRGSMGSSIGATGIPIPGIGAVGGAVGGAAGIAVGLWEKQNRLLQQYFPRWFPWMPTGPATVESGRLVTRLVGILYLLIVLLDLLVVTGIGALERGSGTAVFFLLLLLASIIAVLLLISRQPQNRKALLFLTPGLPYVPAIAVTVNIYLIFKLSILTLVRFTVWMTIGFAVYFRYGIKNSTLESPQDRDQSMELSVASAMDNRDAQDKTKPNDYYNHLSAP